MTPGLPTEEAARSRMHYDPDTGDLTWKTGQRRGKQANFINKRGYVAVKICRKKVSGHRLAWLIYYGQWPDKAIDHINGVRHDNRIANLREVEIQENNQNRRYAFKTNATGLLGVTVRNGRFQAFIRHAGKNHYLGTFDTAEAAHVAYITEKRIHHAGCTI